MVLFNYTTREITAKIVYYGPGLGGKTTNLQSIYDDLPPEMKGKMLSLATKSDRTLFFDFLPIDLGSIGGMKVRVQLYTVPGQVYYNSTRKLVLKGADGVVFVADSQRAMEEANRDSLDNLYQNLAEQNVKIDGICIALQCNKRDLGSAMPVTEMDQRLNRGNWPVFEAVATQGIGVQETLREMLKLVVLSLKEKYDFSVGESALLEELNQAGEALKGKTATPDPHAAVAVATPAVQSAITAPMAKLDDHAGLELGAETSEPLHALSADLHTSGNDAGTGDSDLLMDQVAGGVFAGAAAPEMELFELDDEFLETGEDDLPGEFQNTIDDPYGDDVVLVFDEDESDALPVGDGSSSVVDSGRADIAEDSSSEVSTAVEDDDSLEFVETEEPLDTVVSGTAVDVCGVSGSEAAVAELNIPGAAPEAGDTEVTVPLRIRLTHKGQPLDLRFSLTLRLED
jgi:signal recognition particle receptor subunit beta